MVDRTRDLLLRAVVFLGLLVVLVLGWTVRGSFTPAVHGEAAPAYEALSLQGEPVSLESLRGKVVLFNVWATWCPPCRWEMPAMERLHQELGGEGLEVVAVSVDAATGRLPTFGGPTEEVRSLVHELGLTFTILLDPASEVQRRFGVQGLPTTFLIDRQGRIVERILGPRHWDQPPEIDRIRALLGG